jgi:hypothetical protein
LNDEFILIKYIINKKMIFKYKKVDGTIGEKLKTSLSINIRNDNIEYEINGLHCVIPITNTINVEQYDL